MRLPYLRLSDPHEKPFIPLFQAWGDLLLSRHMAHKSTERWMEGLATRWTVQTAWACFELACHLALGLDPLDKSQQLSPGFWGNLNRTLAQRSLSIAPINHRAPPWDDWLLIQMERHPFAHLGAGGGRFPRKDDADLAAEEAEKAVRRFLSLVGVPAPRWLTVSGAAWPQDGSPLQSNFGRGSGMGVGGTLTVQSAKQDDPTTIRLAIVATDGKESCDLYPAGFNWKPRVEQLLNGLGSPIWGIRVYDSNQTYLEEPLLMWGGNEFFP